MRRGRAGFTLVELLISLAILGLIATLGYRALASLTDSEVKLTAESRRWQDLDAMFARIEADMRDAIPRAGRTEAASEPPWIGDADAAGNAALRFSRAGPEFVVEPGSAGQRIGYRLRDAAVEVLYWPRLDQPASVDPQAYALASGIAGFRVAYLDDRDGWRDRWPVPGESAVPRAVRVVVTLGGGEVLERWLALR
jgi:general secretion pathway protein J